MALNILETEQQHASLEWDSAERVHAGLEAMRLAFTDALAYDADPEVLHLPHLMCITFASSSAVALATVCRPLSMRFKS